MSGTETVQKMIDWVEENLTENPMLLGTSKQVYICPTYCSSQFHQIVGTTLKHYMAGRRLCQVMLAIKDTTERILDIAAKLRIFFTAGADESACICVWI